MSCQVCGIINPDYDQDPDHDDASHFGTVKHACNRILYDYKYQKKQFGRNREGIYISGGTHILNGSKVIDKPEMTDHHKIRISVKPKQDVKFIFDIRNDWVKEDPLVVGIHLAHPQPQFEMSEHPYIFGEVPHVWEKKTFLKEEVSVNFLGSDIGQYEMPIMFTFHRPSTNKNFIFIKEMVVMVEENPQTHKMSKNPYTDDDMKRAKCFIRSTRAEKKNNNSIGVERHSELNKTVACPRPPVVETPSQGFDSVCVPKHTDNLEARFKIPPLLKLLFPCGLDENALQKLAKGKAPEVMDDLRKVLYYTRNIFDEGITRSNYMMYFHHLLWWEETKVRFNLRRYNMPGVTLVQKDHEFVLEVPGLAEKRPSLLRGDRVLLQPTKNQEMIFESVIKHIDDNYVHLADLDQRFYSHHTPETTYAVRFMMSRVPMERSHEAIERLFTSKQDCRVFPEPRKANIAVKPIQRFYNSLIQFNEEQRRAVEHIVAGSSGKAPYVVFGPPGTGKTMTIVEAIVQLVARNPRNRVMVCTDSNMAADHIALMLLKYNKTLNCSNFILRANSQSREWSVMPEALAPVSNGTKYENFVMLSNSYMSTFRIVVTTLMHAAKYTSARSQRDHKLQISHLFIDEAAQASEPHCLVPITGLLTPTGQLVLAGDPQQLGPVCISKEASRRGLDSSLLERLIMTHPNLYEKNPNYMTMLVRNFRSDADILKLPNQLFYKDELIAMAPPDPISTMSILGLAGGERAIVFHAVHSREQKMGNAPSYFNEKELDMLKRYVRALINNHKVAPQDIGVIAPYIRQVYKMKAWLVSQEYDKVEVGTVEAFQGKEKRVVLVSTVRANCRLLDYDALYGLGFLVDDKRFNVTLTRAKAKLIIIGNPTCLTRDLKWNLYMEQCKELSCFFGEADQQLPRTAELLKEVAQTRFIKCGLTKALKENKCDEKVKKFNKG